MWSIKITDVARDVHIHILYVMYARGRLDTLTDITAKAELPERYQNSFFNPEKVRRVPPSFFIWEPSLPHSIPQDVCTWCITKNCGSIKCVFSLTLFRLYLFKVRPVDTINWEARLLSRNKSQNLPDQYRDGITYVCENEPILIFTDFS